MKHGFKFLPLIIVILALPFYLYHLGYNFKGYDEGVHFYIAWMISQGALPFRDFYCVYIPFIHVFVALLYKIFGVSILIPRLLTILFAYLTGFVIYKISYKITQNRLSSSISLLVYLFNLYSLVYLRQFRPLSYMLFLGFISLYFIQKGLEGRKRDFLCAGIFVGLSTLAKFQGFVFFISASIFLILYKRFRLFAIYLLGFIIVFVPAFLLLLNISPKFMDTALKFHLTQPRQNLVPALRGFTYQNLLLILLGLPFLFKYILRKKLYLPHLLILLFLLLLLIPIVLSKIIWLQYFYPLVPLTSIFVGGSFFKAKKLIPFLSLILIVHFGLEIRKGMKYLRGWVEFDHGTTKVVELIQRYTSPRDYIFCEIFHINVLAQRKNPPWLSDISHTRIVSQGLGAEDIIAELEKYNVKMIIFEHRVKRFRLKRLKDYGKFVEYLKSKYIFLGYVRRNFDILVVFLRK